MGEVSIATLLLKGLGLGVLLILICAFGIRNGAVGMLQLYHKEVQDRCVELGLTTHEKIKRNSLMFKLCCLPMYIVYVLVCVYILNGVRESMNLKEIIQFVKAIAKGSPSLEDLMKKKKEPCIYVDMVCVREEYQGQGYMRKVMDIAFADRHRGTHQ